MSRTKKVLVGALAAAAMAVPAASVSAMSDEAATPEPTAVEQARWSWTPWACISCLFGR